jgi:UrcA family protein
VALAAALPASAQTVGEITVTGRYGAGADIRSLSAPVSFADLDLTMKADQDELKTRIKTTARGLCNDLGESNVSSGVTPACDDAATKDAWTQAKLAIDTAVPRTAPMAMSMPMPESAPMAAPAATAYSAPASYTTSTVTNGPVADTPENRAMYGQPMSNAGKRTAPVGN